MGLFFSSGSQSYVHTRCLIIADLKKIKGRKKRIKVEKGVTLSIRNFRDKVGPSQRHRQHLTQPERRRLQVQ